MTSHDYLPPDTTAPLTLLAVPGAALQGPGSEAAIRDAISVISPDAIVAVQPDANLAAQHLRHKADLPVFALQHGMRYRTVASEDTSVILVSNPNPDTLPDDPASIVEDPTSPSHAYLLSSTFELRVDPHHRETRIAGLSTYAGQLPDAWLAAESNASPGESCEVAGITHASTALRAGFSTERRVTSGVESFSIPIAGVGTSTSQVGAAVDTTAHELAVVTLHPNGLVTADRYPPADFGISGIEQVGPARTQSFESHDVTRISDVADMSVATVADMLDVGDPTARTVSTSAQSLASGRVIRTSSESLPAGEPLYIDIETDGLSGATVWLVGVLDGTADDGSYSPFRQRSPPEPAAHLDAFATCLEGVAPNRPIVAWNGYGFDFDILAQQFRDHYPDYLDTWESHYTFDPLYWARDQGNAVLPGRSNKLEHVAEALGWEGTSIGIDGETAAAVYTRWRDRMQSVDNPTDVAQPDWERLETYCEDDVRALATIYEAIGDASATEVPADDTANETLADPSSDEAASSGGHSQSSTQETLSEFT